MTPQQYKTARSLLRTINGGTDIGDWAKGITARNRAGLPVNKNELATAQELLQMADKLRKK